MIKLMNLNNDQFAEKFEVLMEGASIA